MLSAKKSTQHEAQDEAFNQVIQNISLIKGGCFENNYTPQTELFENKKHVSSKSSSP